ncbi:MAG: tetratricopeptide repeat protein [Oscillospiraceae bacterium]
MAGKKSNGEKNYFAQIFACIAIIEGVFFLCLLMSKGDENDRLCCIMALGVALAAAAGTAVVCGFRALGYRLGMNRAALKALGKQGIRKIRNDEAAKYAYKGIVKLFQGKYPDADDLLQRALSLSTVRQNQMFCIEWLIKLYEATDNDSRLLWCYRKAAEFAPDDPEVQSRLGHAYYADGKLSNAEYCFKQALEYDPNHGYSYYSLAKIHMVRGEDDKALELLLKLSTIQENHPLVLAELATWYAIHDDEEKCREYYEKAMLCGYKDPEELSKRMTALYQFNHAAEVSGNDLPWEYYKRITLDEETEKGDTDAGNV